MPRKIDFWDVDDSAESLCHTEIGEAISYWADALGPDEVLPRTVKVYGWSRREVPFSEDAIAEDALEHIAEYLLEEYVSPDDGPDWSREVWNAARALGRAIREKWDPWSCEVVTEEEVDMAEWVRENYPRDAYPDHILVETGPGTAADPRMANWPPEKVSTGPRVGQEPDESTP